MKTGNITAFATALLLAALALQSASRSFAQCPPDALLHSIPNPGPAADDDFARSVAISGNLAVIGAHHDDAGATDGGTAYVFNTSTGALVATLNNPDPTAGDLFGKSVAISGNVAVVGASSDDAGATGSGTAYVFNATTGALTATLSNPARIVKILPYLEEG